MSPSILPLINQCIFPSVLLLGLLLSTGAVAAHDSVIVDTSISVNDSLEEVIEETEETIEESNDLVEDTADDITDGVDETANEFEGSTKETTETITETADGSIHLVNHTAKETMDNLNETINETIDELNDTVNESTGMLFESANSTDDRTNVESEKGSPIATAIHINEGPNINADSSGFRDEPASKSSDTAGRESSGTSRDVSLLAVWLLTVVANSASVTSTLTTGLYALLLSPKITNNAFLHPVRIGRTRPWGYVSTIFRYSRYDDSDPLEHDERRVVHETINGCPGIYLTELAERTAIPLSTARHHLRVLEMENLIKSEEIRGKRRYYSVETSNINLAAALTDPATRRLLEALATLGRARNDQLATVLDRDPSTISHHLIALEEDGMVLRERDGRAVINQLDPDTTLALQRDRISFDSD